MQFKTFGKVPKVQFMDNEIYRVLDEKYIYVHVSFQTLFYEHSYEDLKEYYKENKIDLSYLIGKNANTDMANFIYKEACKNIYISEEKYLNHIVKVVRKFQFLGNDNDDIFADLCFFFQSPSNPYKLVDYLSDDEIISIIEEASKKKYKPQKSVVVFNPNKRINNTFKQIQSNKELAKFNRNLVKKSLSKSNVIKAICEETNLARTTVKEIIKELGITTQGNKSKSTKSEVQKWRKKNKRGTQKQCSEELQKSLRTIKTYWNS